jgi:tetratricopeptide (TPR) repeat protein
VAIIVLTGLLAYANSFSGPFIADDEATVVENTSIRDLRSTGVLFPQREVPTAGRPIVNVSFAINYALGGMSVRGYHVPNLATHLLCAVVLFGLVRRTLELARVRFITRYAHPRVRAHGRHLVREQLEEAARYHRAYLSAKPDDVAARGNLAKALFNKGDVDGAAAEAHAILRISDDAAAHDLLGRVLGSQGKLEEARIEFERALKIDPNFQQAREDLALIKRAKG